MRNYLKFLMFSYLFISTIYGFPDSRNPNSEYELVNVKNLEPLHNVIINTPPPPPPDSKLFAYDPVSKTWTKVKPGDPQPSNDTLTWNQSNDKWLTIV